MSEAERRQSPRQSLAVPIVLEVELHGFDRGDDRFTVRGKTVNMARGGALLTADRAIETGVHCVVHFPQTMGLLGRSLLYGTIRRCDEVSDGCVIALVFDTPIQALELPADGES